MTSQNTSSSNVVANQPQDSAMATTTDYVALGSVHNPEATSIQDEVTSLASSGSVSGTSSTGDCDSVLNSSVHSLSDDDRPKAMTSERKDTKSDITAEAETQKGGENGDMIGFISSLRHFKV